MRMALLFLLALAGPAAACPTALSPAEALLILAGPLFAGAIGVAWLYGVLQRLLGRRGAAARTLARATLSVGLVEAVTLAACPLSMVAGYPYNRLIVPATLLVMLFAGPVWAWRCLSASEARGGQLAGRAGSLFFPISFVAGLALCQSGVTAGGLLIPVPLLALFAIPIDRGPEGPYVPPASRRSSASSGHCPVCREVVRDRLATCPRCHTPHHRECLDFNGRCGIFACEPGAPDPTAKKKTAS